jgi:hypothetical protein
MSSPTQPMTDAGRSAADLGSELAHDEHARAIEVSRAAPPQEVLDLMAQADLIGQALREAGREIVFTSTDGELLPAIELRDTDGNLIRTITAAEAAEIVAGRPVE